MITNINEFKQKLNENANVKPKSREDFENILNIFIYTMISSFSENDMVSMAIVNIYEKVTGKKSIHEKNEFDEYSLSIPEMDECWNEIKLALPNISENVMNDIMTEYEYEFEDIILNDEDYNNSNR